MTLLNHDENYDFIKTEKPDEEMSFVVPGLVETNLEESDSGDPLDCSDPSQMVRKF